jgi:uncharacterized protein YbjT (DUF2867 family)
VAELDVVTGAFSFTGRHIAEALLARDRRVRTLTRRPDPEHPLARRIERAPLVFDDRLVDILRGADTLYNTYWIRFERGSTTFDRAVANTVTLFAAAREAGVRRIVHISVANADEASPFAYYKAKARAERTLRESGIPYGIVRPTLVYGPNDILVTNIAWALRRVPVFLIPGDGRYEVQPVSVWDVARICIELGNRDDEATVDAAGPQRFTFREYVQLIKRAVGGRAWIRTAPTAIAHTVGALAGLALRDVVATGDELQATQAGLLVSHDVPRGSDRFEDWVMENGSDLGRKYASELGRNFRGQAEGLGS